MEEFLIFYKQEAETIDDFFIVSARSKREAMLTFAQVEGVWNPDFRELVYTQSTNMSFAERFFHDSSDPLIDDINGEPLYPPDVIEQKFTSRVKDFFSNNALHAQKYLDFFNEQEVDTIEELATRHPFPPEMLVTMWHAAFSQDMVVLSLNSIQRLNEQ